MNPEDPEQLDPLLTINSDNEQEPLQEIRPSQIISAERNNAQINIQVEMTNSINQSLVIKCLQILFSSLKILISTMMLIYYPKRCSVPLDKWLILMAFNDGLHIGSIIASIFLASRIEENLNRRQANNVNNANDNHSPRLSENFEQQELRNHIEMRNYEETNKCFYFIQEGIKIYYIGILVWGHALLYLIENDCKNVSPGLTLLVLIFLIFGYFYLFYPVFIVLTICLCLPVLIIAVYYFGGRGQHPADREIIEKLPKIKYSKKDFQEPSCVICQCEFEENEEILKLPCPNADHIFHSECVVRWLKINGICPICRHKIRK